MSQSITQTIGIVFKEESREMMAIWPDIVRDITEAAENFYFLDVAKWFEKVLEYNVPGGKKIRSITFIYVYKMLVPNDQLSKDNIHLIRILAWCLEILQSFYFMIDDIINRRSLRRGKPCWYRYNDVPEAVFNDGYLIYKAIFYIIQKHFSGREYYVDLMEIFYETVLMSIMGQTLELYTNNFNKKPNLDLFTMSRYNSIAEFKTARESFSLPVTMAMQLAGIKDQEIFRQVTPILLEIGLFFQIQDDYVTFYNSEICGKVDTDVQERKCTWFAVKALELVTPEQRKILEECYGISDPDKVKRVKQLFIDLNLLDAYLTYEKEAHNMINVHIQQISCGLLRKFLSNLLGHLYRRMS